MPSRNRNAYQWVIKNPHAPPHKQRAFLNVSTKIPFVVGDIVKGCNTDRDYRIFDAGATHFKTRRLDDNIIKSVGVATAGTLIISAEETQRRFAAYEKWLEKQQKETI